MDYKKNELLRSVFEDTLELIKERGIDCGAENTLKYDELIECEVSNDAHGKVEVVDSDTLDCAKKLIDDGFKEGEVCVLNMGSIFKYGGGVEKGSRAQEECLCRRSTLYPMLKAYADSNKGTYPNGGEYDVIYTANVMVLKSSKYEELEHPYRVNVVTVAAIKKPTLIDGGLSANDTTFLMHKIRQMINVAAYNGNRALVLGAFGCGAYGCPSRDVARIFNHVLNEEGLKNLFDVVKFAIIDDHNAFRENNKEGNLSVFKETIA